MTSIISRAINKARRDGLIELVHDAWYELYRNVCTHAPKSLQWPLAQLYWLPYGCVIRRKDNFWERTGRRNSFIFPQLEHHKRSRISFWQYVYGQYTSDGFVEVSKGDVVVDVGGLVGEFTILAAESAKRVIVLEPNPRSAQCIRENTKRFENVEVIEKAAWNESTTIDLNLGLDASDDSLLTPDDGGREESISVQADTLSNIVKGLDIDTIDFLKVDAEGAEPEVISGIDDITVRKIAANCGPERDGEPTDEEVSRYLQAREYNTKRNPSKSYETVFAVL